MRKFLTFAMLFVCTGIFAQHAQINHVTVHVTDLKRASAFYHDVMKLDTISEPFKDGKHTWFRIGPHQQLHVVAGATEDIPHDVEVHTAFSVSDIAGFCRHLDQMNVKYGDFGKFDKKIRLRPDGVQQIYLQDPDGYWIEVNNDRF